MSIRVSSWRTSSPPNTFHPIADQFPGRRGMSTLKTATRPRHSRIGIAIAAALGLLSSGAVMAQQASATAAPPAQNATDDAAAKAEPGEKATELDAVLVTAGKRIENIREVPSSISVISQDEIENLHATQLSDFAGARAGPVREHQWRAGKDAGVPARHRAAVLRRDGRHLCRRNPVRLQRHLPGRQLLRARPAALRHHRASKCCAVRKAPCTAPARWAA